MAHLLAEGKTKKIIDAAPGLVEVISKDDITAGDGKKHDIIPHKGEYSTTTTCSVFSLLKWCGFPLAFREQSGPASFIADNCRMLPFEVVVRRKAYGSIVKRASIRKGTLLDDLVVEFYLKTKDRLWKGIELKCDDPYMYPKHGAFDLYEPSKQFIPGTFFTRLTYRDVFELPEDELLMGKMATLAREAFCIVELAWHEIKYELVDFKVEFGISPEGELLIADVIDNDSWRLLRNGIHMDKQGYRDGEPLELTAQKYAQVAADSKLFEGVKGYVKTVLFDYPWAYRRVPYPETRAA